VRGRGTIRVVVAGRDAAERADLRAVLEEDGVEVAFEAADESELLVLSQIERPEAAVVVAEPTLFDAPRALIELRTEMPELPVVVVSAQAGQRPISKALRNGAVGYVYADQVEDVLTCAVRAAVAGMTCVPKEVRRHAIAPAFSHRERQVLDLAVRGYTNTQIARELFLAESTVKSHLSACFRKLGVSSRAEAAAALTTTA
jgi:DNA-binding NarL/FixJ family response regulator